MRARKLYPPTPDLQITIAGADRHLVADALIEACRGYEDKVAELRRQRRGPRIPGHSERCADRLRAIYDRVVP